MMKALEILLVLTPCAFAQGPGLFPWWESPIAQNINLTVAQRKQIQATVREYRDQLIQMRADLQKAEGRLSDLMNEDPVDQAKATEAIDKVVSSRAALMKAIAVMSLKLRQTLTVEQWRQLERWRAQRGAGQNALRPLGHGQGVLGRGRPGFGPRPKGPATAAPQIPAPPQPPRE